MKSLQTSGDKFALPTFCDSTDTNPQIGLISVRGFYKFTKESVSYRYLPTLWVHVRAKFALIFFYCMYF